MARRFRSSAHVLLALSLAVPASAATPVAPRDDASIVHALNRLGYGPRPGDVERVRQMGLDAWIDLQLHPDRIADAKTDSAVASLRTVRLSSRELMAGYDLPREAKREAARRRNEMAENASEETVKRARRELLAKYRSQMEGSPREVVNELQQAKLLRAVTSERQLGEVLGDFWLNHFNVYAQKGLDRFLIGAYERDTIRPHVFGRFEELLKATAESPAMLFYLDNWRSSSPNAQQPRAGRRAPQKKRSPGLNENYAREIMELHTLGVDGGYSQQDVTEVARCFTGWTIRGLRDGRPEFAFDARRHDAGDKLVLGRVIKNGGKHEGDEVIHLLATHPSTARFLALKLARRFVADEPPPALVDRAAETFRKTDGDLRAVVATIVGSPEFFAPEARAAKLKTPLEFVASALRASGATLTDAGDLTRRIAAMGMPLYLQQPPTGYKDTADAWVGSSGLLARLNLALDLAAGRVGGVSMPALPQDAAQLAAQLVPAGLSESTRRTLASEAGAEPARMAGLVLGSPEFQRK
jgi:uncharacterized protein (DUF1800 family)